jgi:PAS domain-containing protein
MMGYTKEELLKKKFTELISPESLKDNPIRMDELNSGRIVQSERKVIRKDGSEILVEINAKLRPDGFLPVIYSVMLPTEKKQIRNWKSSYKANPQTDWNICKIYGGRKAPYCPVKSMMNWVSS